ncbi:AAA family ATPase [Vibrio parahaemolyticus]|nr:AAA family ATPase [Vibrio parahaemolyticus]
MQKEPIFEYFKIFKLHNEKNISLEMDNFAKILVSDNGSGKTTLLNCMYYILDKSFDKLAEIDFEKIELKFSTGVELTLEKSQVIENNYIPKFKDSYTQRIFSNISRTRLIKLVKLASSTSYFKFSQTMKENYFIDGINHSIRETYEALNRLERTGFVDSLEDSIYEDWSRIVDKNVNLKVLYLPTYRRIEQDISNIDNIDYVSNNGLINFGMKDVKNRFDKISSDLKDSAVRLYTSLNGKVLTHLTFDYKANKEQYDIISNTQILKIVLGRVGDNISSDTKDRIISLVESGNIKDARYHPLVFVLSNLVEVYYAQKEQDDSIKEFVLTVNKYLSNKKFIYDESSVEITIINLSTNKEVSLEKLSSGEKQLVSIFSRLYLEDNNTTYAVLFDEPELSLSIEWQATLLPDIVNSHRCGFLIAATHSPFIFNNELDSIADNLCVDYDIEENDG